MSNDRAAFYIGTGPEAEYVGELDSENGHPTDFDRDFPYRYSDEERTYTLDDFLYDINLFKLIQNHDPESQPEWIFAYTNGAIHIFHQNFLMAQIFPYGARRQTVFPSRTE